MAFSSNNSAFGFKPAPPATGTSLFGGGTSTFGQSQQQQQTSLFGQPQGQQQQPAAGTSLFGQPAQQQQQQAAAGTSLFGQPAQQQQQPAAGTSLFGQPAQQPAAGTSLFGQQQQPAATGGSIFGQPAQQPALGGFGQPAQQQQPATNIFGQQQQNNPFGQSALGSTNNNAQQPQGSLFGSTAVQPQGFGGNSLFGQKPQQPQLGVNTQNNAAPLFTKTTKFNDLPDEVKRTLESLDSHIQGRVQIGKELQRLKLGDEPSKGQDLVRGIYKELVNASSVTHSDLLYARDLKAKADQSVQDTIIATRIIDGFKNPQQNGTFLKNHATFPFEYFTRITEEMRERLLWYKATIEQIERKLSSSASQVQQTPQAIAATLQAQHATFIALASKTAALETELHKIKSLYTQLWRSKTGSMRDPFDIDKGGDLGFSSLDVK
ncbi:hypothetical protein ONZ45_g13240 [Pleurotus djamor]|nr:hypothetical protein ONZ45_g13240 [Pleurotus djamor]